MLARIPHPEDFHLAQLCLEGDERAITSLQKGQGQQTFAYLLGRGASAAEAEEIVDSLWADCLAGTLGKRPRIASYQGNSSLQTWLNSVAVNTFLTAKRNDARRAKVVTERIHGPEDDVEEGLANGDGNRAFADPGNRAAEEPLISMLRAAIEHAFSQCSPEDFVLLQLAYSDGIRQADLAPLWGCDAATISRKLKRAGAQVNEQIIAHVRASDPWLEIEWRDLLELCRVANPACFGQLD